MKLETKWNTYRYRLLLILKTDSSMDMDSSKASQVIEGIQERL